MEKYKKLYELRKKFSYSCQDMASKLDISSSYYWQIENGYRRLFYDIAVKIADILNLRPDDIFYY